MLTVAEETLKQLAAEHGKQVATHLYGQEINAETYAIAKADFLLKGEGDEADNLVGGPEHSTLPTTRSPREFDFMLSNPPYGKSWKTDQERMGGKDGMKDPRFVIEHAGDPEYSLLTRSSDGQMLFLANMLSKMKRARSSAAASPRCTTAPRSSPATPARARATSAAGSSRTTGWRPSSPCR
jgi:type I restriction enzyme M protein